MIKNILEGEHCMQNNISQIQKQYLQLHDSVCGYNQEKLFCDSLVKELQNIFDTIPSDRNIAIRAYGDVSKWIIDKIDFFGKKCVICDKDTNKPSYKGIKVYHYSDLVLNKDGYFFVNVSFNYRREIVSDFEKDQVMYIDIYRELEKRDIHLNTAPVFYRQSSHAIPNFFWRQYKKERNEQSLRKYVAALIEAYDFAGLEVLLNNENTQWLKRVEHEYEKLKILIKEALKNRVKKYNDILLFWIDAVPHKWKKNLPFINSLSDSTLSFENVYAMTPFTHQTFKAMFDRQKPLEDYKKSVKLLGNHNCELIEYLETKNYSFIQFGDDGCRYVTCEPEYLENMDEYVTCNYIYWTAMMRMLESNSPCFYILHSAIETHPPMVSPELNDYNVYISSDDYYKQAEISYAYFDRSFRYYFELLEGYTCILMSDHGEHISNKKEKFWSQNKIHTWMMISDDKLKPQKEYRLFSYLKFIDLIKYLLQDADYDSLFSEIVTIQDIDFYYEDTVKRLIQTKEEERFIAYRAAFDGTYKFAINRGGQKFYYKVKGDVDIPISSDNLPSAFDALEKEAGNYFPQIWDCEKYKYCKDLYKGYLMHKKEREGNV